MKPLEIALMGFYLCVLAATTWLFWLVVLGMTAPAWLALSTLLLVALMTAFLAWVRRMPGAARRRGLTHGLLAGLIPVLAVLVLAWRRGQLQDGWFHSLFFYTSVYLVAVELAMLMPYWLAWRLSTLVMSKGDARETDETQHTSADARWLAVMIAATQVFFCAGPWAQLLDQVDSHDIVLRNRGRGIWTAIVSGSMEREENRLPPLWPRELGFTGTESSTDYFRRLMSDAAGEVTDDREEALAPDLSHSYFCGPGLREATSARAFSAEHNAWQVVCVDSNTPDWMPFLISRNADFGDWLTPTSQVRLIRSGPLKLRSVAWVTCGGMPYDATFKRFRIGMMYPPGQIGQDAATTAMVYRIMRP
jgi:hypothetical protein